MFFIIYDVFLIDSIVKSGISSGMSTEVDESSFFEGPEKKLELVFRKSSNVDLLKKPQAFWNELVELASAKILSSLETQTCKAFLLSESSLFVWTDRIILITCGTTTLIHAAKHLLNVFGEDAVQEIFYERKNEYEPSLQITSATDDMKTLKSLTGGQVSRLGRKDDHHVYVFNSEFKNTDAPAKVKTLELLMYGLQGEFKDFFGNDKVKQDKALSSLKSILPDFEFDPYFFEPEGFSFNALRGDQYATMHVTPQGSENYLSFEIDQINEREAQTTINDLVELCRPLSFDTVFFTTDQKNIECDFKKYSIKQRSKLKTQSGYEVFFSHFYDQEKVEIEPFVL